MAQQPVDLELLLAVDASGSVDAQEFDLQRRALADAFRDAEVIAALAAHAPAPQLMPTPLPGRAGNAKSPPLGTRAGAY
jgi:hypothetical protein